MKKILLTGANGFVGRHFIELISESSDYFILGITHDGSLPSTEKSKYITGNIMDRNFLEDILQNNRPDYIIHLAAKAVTHGEDPEGSFKVNFFGTLNLFEAVVKIKSDSFNPKIIYISSAEVYGKTKTPENITEDNPLFPINYYGVSKVAADRLSYQYTQSHKLNVVILRPFNHLGPGQTKGFFVPDMASQIAEIEKSGSENGQIMTGNLDSVRDFLDVRDVVKAYKLSLEKDLEPSSVFNISSGRGIKVSELLDKLLSLSNKKIEIKTDPNRLRPSEIPITIGNSSKFRGQTGWEPKIPIDQTLEDTLEYWRNM